MRSYLFVPGDSRRKLEKAVGSRADALIIDLEDSVAPQAKAEARDATSAFLGSAHSSGPRLFVRVNALDTGLTDVDLDAVLPSRPAGIVLPKSLSGEDVTLLDAKLTAREALFGLPDGGIAILAIATETAASLFRMGTYMGASNRLIGLAWGGEDLSADIGAETNRLPDGTYAEPYRLARTLCLLGAVAVGCQPVDAVATNFRDEAALRAEAEAARRDGFTGKMAVHPAQVPVINDVFTPKPVDIERA
jgi:citrate lyase subunit beta / citryl-CoA lyase